MAENIAVIVAAISPPILGYIISVSYTHLTLPTKA